MLRFGAAVAVAVVGLVGTAVGLNPPPPAAPTDDLGAVQGYWKPLSIEYQGKTQATADELKKITTVFDGAESHLYYKDPAREPVKLARTAVTFDPTTTPKSVTFEYAIGDLKGQKRHGIYELAGDQLKLCYGPVDKPKPTQFAAPAGSGYFLEVWAKQPTK